MKSLTLGIAAALVVASVACSNSNAKEPDALQIPTGSDVTLERRDGVKVSGRLVEVQAQDVVLELRDGQKTRVARTDIVALRGATISASPAPASTTSRTPESSSRPPSKASARSAATAPVERPAPTPPAFREVTVPAGTVLPIELSTTVGSATSQVEDHVRGTIRKAVTVDGI